MEYLHKKDGLAIQQKRPYDGEFNHKFIHEFTLSIPGAKKICARYS